MRGEVVGTEIGFDLNNFTDVFSAVSPANEPFSQQILRDERGVAVVKKRAEVSSP